MDITTSIQKIQAQALEDLKDAHHSRDIELLKVKYLGKKGLVHGLMEFLKDADPAERPKRGKMINDLKVFIETAIENLMSQIEQKELDERLRRESIDITLPGRRHFQGKRHIALKVLDQALEILVGMGFSVQYGPEIELDYYNFEALNFAKDHPARDMQDTFYITSDTLLRTHTSNTQIRIMESHKPPIRIAAPGKCYRNEDISARSHVIFHQIEGLYIDKNVTFSDLLSTLQEFFSKLLQQEVKMRFRPSYFPFVEPGMEVDIECLQCKGEGCVVCKRTGWLEVLGAGMIHPEVLKSGGIDPEEYSGYAWGCGTERLAMLYYGINDIRLFWENQLRFLQQF
jgi:phenylalanyl-tRNA synthetase alpha chain